MFWNFLDKSKHLASVSATHGDFYSRLPHMIDVVAGRGTDTSPDDTSLQTNDVIA